jgi:general secretion pathway protein D
LTLKFTPQVFPNQDVQVKMSIESKDVLGASTLTPTFTERTITGTARVQNNKTMMLASVAQDVQSSGRQGLPILGLIPVLGRLFTSPTRDNRRIDIVIAVTPRVLRAPAVTPRDEEMRPSGTLQSPTTGTLEAMLREVDREDQLAAAQAQKQNATAKARTAPADPVWTIHTNAEAKQAESTVAGNTPANNPASSSNANVGNETTTPVNPLPSAIQSTAKSAVPVEDSPAFVPAPKSLVSSSDAANVATVNSNLKGEGHAVMTSLTKPVEVANTSAPAPKTVQLSVVPADETLKSDDTLRVGETRRFAIEVKAGAQLSFAMLALRFDPKVVKIKTITPGNILASQEGKPADGVTQSLDLAGLCMISMTNANGLFSASAGNLLFVEVEAIAFGAPGLILDKGAMHIVAKDAQGVLLDLTPIRIAPKQ